MDELQMLDTVLAKPEPSQEVVDRGRRQLHRAARGPARRRSTRVLAGSGLGLVAAAAAAAVVISSGATPSGPNRAGRETPTPAGQLSGRQILLAAAKVAATRPDATGTYWHVKVAEQLGAVGK